MDDFIYVSKVFSVKKTNRGWGGGGALFTHYLSSRLRQHLLQLKELNGRYLLKEPVQQIAEHGRLDQYRFPDGFISTGVTAPRMVST